jgi:hypothetical protein
MATKADLQNWVRDALISQSGSARIPVIAAEIWLKHEVELKRSGDLFYTWQYDMRWAANRLRKSSIMKAADASPSGVWELAI